MVSGAEEAMNSYFAAFLGGALIGSSALVLLLGKGQIAGISGIVGSFVNGVDTGSSWRALFLLGLCLGPVLFFLIAGRWPPVSVRDDWGPIVIGGLLVGFGTRLGSGCTSGHGVCGLARLSKRSLVATAIFLAAAVVTVLFTHIRSVT